MIVPLWAFARVIVVLLVTSICSAPAIAGSRPCNGPGALRANGTASTIEVTNRRSTPLGLELVDGSDETTTSLALAPGESKVLQTYQTHTWMSRDARRRCLSRFISERELEKWDIVEEVGVSYERRNVRSFPVYIAPEFSSHDRSLLERCLHVLQSNVSQLEKIVPPSAWQRISGIPIWLEYEPDGSYGGVYFASKRWLAANGIAIAKVKSIQFASSLAVMLGSPFDPLMHELAHAYHDLVLSFDYPQIRMAFARAAASGRYNAVRRFPEGWERAPRTSSPASPRACSSMPTADSI
jgi:hypothetical protein